MTKLVHVLVAGQALCGREGTPNTWAKHEVWTSPQEFANLTDGELEDVQACEGCKQELEGRKLAV